MKSYKKSDIVFDSILAAFMVLLVILTIYPIYYILINSISSGAAVSANQVLFWPKDITFTAYSMALKDPFVVSGFGNSIYYTLLGTTINVILTAMCAYPLSRKDFYGRGTFMGLILFTMFFSGGIIPLFLTVSDLNLYDSRWAVILPAAISVYNMIVMRTFFQSIPFELTESAYIDGANDLKIFVRIILPLSMPIIATMILFYGVSNWNSFYNALMFLADKSKYPIQMILRNIVLEGGTSDIAYAASSEGVLGVSISSKSIKYAVIAVTTMPVIIIYPFVFKYFKKGVMIGSVKG